MTEDLYWSFGFGSNMDVNFVEKQKGVKIIDHKPAILSGYRLSFSFPGYPLFEPAFGNVVEDPTSDVHGVAFGMNKDSADRIVAVEPKQYKKRDVLLRSYDGQELKAFIFVVDGDLVEKAPSNRYMEIIIEGAKKAGLKDHYVKKLEQHETYEPPEWVMELRRKRPKLEDLHAFTVDELAEKAAKEKVWFSILGYVIKAVSPGEFEHWRGRDVTTPMYLHFNRLGWYGVEGLEDKGTPPYPLIRDMDSASLEYLTQVLDHFQAGSSEDGRSNMGQIVGHLAEYKQQQDSGKTEWVKPNKKE